MTIDIVHHLRADEEDKHVPSWSQGLFVIFYFIWYYEV
jgi:hypothetical protein